QPDGSDGRGTSATNRARRSCTTHRRSACQDATSPAVPDPDYRCDTLVAMRIGMLTGGGDCPGLNAVIRAVVRKGEGVHGDQLVGFRHGWRGVVEGETVELTIAGTRG